MSGRYLITDTQLAMLRHSFLKGFGLAHEKEIEVLDKVIYKQFIDDSDNTLQIDLNTIRCSLVTDKIKVNCKNLETKLTRFIKRIDIDVDEQKIGKVTQMLNELGKVLEE